MGMHDKVWAFLRENPLPPLILIGLIAGVALRYGAGQPEIARWIWLAALLAGGAPLVLRTVRGMLRGEFASDVVAMLSIVTALAMGEYFAGLISVSPPSSSFSFSELAVRFACRVV